MSAYAISPEQVAQLLEGTHHLDEVPHGYAASFPESLAPELEKLARCLSTRPSSFRVDCGRGLVIAELLVAEGNAQRAYFRMATETITRLWQGRKVFVLGWRLVALELLGEKPPMGIEQALSG